MFRTLTYRSVTFFTTRPFPPRCRRLIRHHGSMCRRSGASVDDAEVQNAFLSSEVSMTPLPPLHLIVLNYKLPASVPKIWHRSKSLPERSSPLNDVAGFAFLEMEERIVSMISWITPRRKKILWLFAWRICQMPSVATWIRFDQMCCSSIDHTMCQ